MSQDKKTVNEIFKEMYSDELIKGFTSTGNPFIRFYTGVKERLSDLVFETTNTKYHFIDYNTNRILEFDTREEYENFLHDIKFNNEFEDKLK